MSMPSLILLVETVRECRTGTVEALKFFSAAAFLMMYISSMNEIETQMNPMKPTV